MIGKLVHFTMRTRWISSRPIGFIVNWGKVFCWFIPPLSTVEWVNIAQLTNAGAQLCNNRIVRVVSSTYVLSIWWWGIPKSSIWIGFSNTFLRGSPIYGTTQIYLEVHSKSSRGGADLLVGYGSKARRIPAAGGSFLHRSHLKNIGETSGLIMFI